MRDPLGMWQKLLLNQEQETDFDFARDRGTRRMRGVVASLLAAETLVQSGGLRVTDTATEEQVWIGFDPAQVRCAVLPSRPSGRRRHRLSGALPVANTRIRAERFR